MITSELFSSNDEISSVELVSGATRPIPRFAMDTRSSSFKNIFSPNQNLKHSLAREKKDGKYPSIGSKDNSLSLDELSIASSTSFSSGRSRSVHEGPFSHTLASELKIRPTLTRGHSSNVLERTRESSILDDCSIESLGSARSTPSLSRQTSLSHLTIQDTPTITLYNPDVQRLDNLGKLTIPSSAFRASSHDIDQVLNLKSTSAENPAPNQYRPEDSLKRIDSSGKLNITSSFRDSVKRFNEKTPMTPGPNEYNVGRSLHRMESQGRIEVKINTTGHDIEKTLNLDASFVSNPGPDNYNIESSEKKLEERGKGHLVNAAFRTTVKRFEAKKSLTADVPIYSPNYDPFNRYHWDNSSKYYSPKKYQLQRAKKLQKRWINVSKVRPPLFLPKSSQQELGQQRFDPNQGQEQAVSSSRSHKRKKKKSRRRKKKGEKSVFERLYDIPTNRSIEGIEQTSQLDKRATSVPKPWNIRNKGSELASPLNLSGREEHDLNDKEEFAILLDDIKIEEWLAHQQKRNQNPRSSRGIGLLSNRRRSRRRK